MCKYNRIIFDLDGTITDSKPGIINSLKYAVDRFGIVVKDAEILKRFIGPPLKESIKSYFSLNNDDADRLIFYFREYYSEKGIYENRLYDGIAELLEKLCDNGIEMNIASTKADIYLKRVLDYFNLTEYFNITRGSNFDGTLSVKSEIVKEVLASMGVASDDRIVMIGDREFDVTGAKENGIDSIAVTYGYGSLEEIEREIPDYIADSVDDLSRIIT